MAIDGAFKEFKSVIRSINWYIKRNKQYESAQFDTWKKSNAAIATTITTAVTTFSFDTLITNVEDYFKHIDANKIELDPEDKIFLSGFENLELFMVNDTLLVLQNKLLTHSEDVVTNFSKMNINVNINIECLDGTEEDLEDWFDNFERIGNANGWTNEIKAYKLPCYLKDTALLIWQNYGPVNKKDYNAIKSEIISKLTPTESLEYTFYSRKQKQTESTIEFSLRLQKLARKAFGTTNKDKDILKIFWQGLKLDIQKLVITATPKSLTEALEFAQKAEKLLGKELKDQPTVNAIEELSINAIHHSRTRSISRSPSPHKYKERSKTPYKKSSSPNRKCYKCDKTGHIASECRSKKPLSSKNKYNCFKCGKTGHIAAKCYSKNE